MVRHVLTNELGGGEAMRRTAIDMSLPVDGGRAHVPLKIGELREDTRASAAP